MAAPMCRRGLAFTFIIFILMSVLVTILAEFSTDDITKDDEYLKHDEIYQNSLKKGKNSFEDGRRFLLYEVNRGEGFNLRRDVYMRIANLVKSLRTRGQDWTLVLPPWSNLHHWRSRHIDQSNVTWATFFDLESLNKHVPVMEYHQYIKETGGPYIDHVYYLQKYAEGWSPGHWEDKVHLRPCLTEPLYRQDEGGRYYGYLWGYMGASAAVFQCLSVQGASTIMTDLLLHNITTRSVMLDRAEELLHEFFAQRIYWNARRSMRFSSELRQTGDVFRSDFLQSTDTADRTLISDDWTTMRKSLGAAKGGAYVGVHLRRRDYVDSRRDQVPTIRQAANQVKKLKKDFKLSKVFLATDATEEEVTLFQTYVKGVVVYKPTEAELTKFTDGGVAIIDQWICAHARVFIGTTDSTFSFRIHEEREILGFTAETTYNRLCSSTATECSRPTHWSIIY